MQLPKDVTFPIGREDTYNNDSATKNLHIFSEKFLKLNTKSKNNSNNYRKIDNKNNFLSVTFNIRYVTSPLMKKESYSKTVIKSSFLSEFGKS